MPCTFYANTLSLELVILDEETLKAFLIDMVLVEEESHTISKDMWCNKSKSIFSIHHMIKN